MTPGRQWLDAGLGDLPAGTADRVRAFRLLIATSQVMRALLDRELASSGITTQQAAMLGAIEACSAPPRLSDIAGAMAMTHQNVKQIAVALERKGFLRIVPDEEDRRARRLVLTAKHRRFWKQRNPGDFSSVEAWTAPLGDDEAKTLVTLLGRLHAHARASSR